MNSSRNHESGQHCLLWLWIFFLSVLPIAAEQKVPQYGFIRLVNAVAPGTGRLRLEIDGNDVYPNGYVLGNVTGGIAVAPGVHGVTLKRDGLLEGTTRVTVDADETLTLISFAEQVPASGERGPSWAMKVLRLRQKQVENRRVATFVSVSSQPEFPVAIGMPGGEWETVYLKRLSTAEISIRVPDSYIPVKAAGKKMPAVPIEELGNYVIVMFDGFQGELRSISFQDIRYLSAD